MRKLNPIYRGIMCCALAIPATAFAQGGGQLLEEIVVTGSLIRGIPEDAAMPVDTIRADELEKQGSPPPLEMLKNLSYMNGIVGESNPYASGRGQAAEGTASINLRGFGAARTLVLLNGKRLASSDANRLPTNAIARVEVLKDGGAVTYGSDAIAGVVNYITKETQDGFELSVDYRDIDGSSGDYNVGLSWGTSTANSDFFAAFNYYHRSPLSVTDRGWALTPYDTNPQGGWSLGSNPGNFLSHYGTPFVDPYCETAGGVTTETFDREGNVNGFQCRTQYTPFGNLVEEQDTYQFFTSYNLSLSDSTDLKLEALYAFTDIPHAQAAPSYLAANYVPLALDEAGDMPSWVIDGTASKPEGYLDASGSYSPFYIIPGHNPYMQQLRRDHPGLSNTPGALITLGQWRPYLAGGNPAYGFKEGWTEKERDQIRLSGELTGMLTDTIGYRTSLSYSSAEDIRREPDMQIGRLQLALNGFAGENCNSGMGTAGFVAGGGSGECYYLNPFSFLNPGLTGAELDEQIAVANWLMEQSEAKSKDELIEFNFVLDGELPVELAGGTIGWAAGVQYRHEEIKNTYSAIADMSRTPCAMTPINGDISCEQNRSAYTFLASYMPYDLDREVKAVFGELMIPVTDNFTAQLAARFEDYGSAGGDSFDPNIRLRWQATDWLAFRASAGTTFRVAPQTSLREVESTGFANVLGTNKPVSSTGNASLEPEEAKNYNLGVMFTGMNYSVTIDYWRYEIDKILTTTPLNGVLGRVFPDADNTAVNNCATVNPAFLSRHFEFAGSCDADNISKVKLYAINGADIVNDGIDIQGRYTWDGVGAGSLTVGGSATWINQYKTGTLTIDGAEFERGFDGVGMYNHGTSLFPLPEWRGNLFLDYAMDLQNIRWIVNYIDGYEDTRFQGKGRNIDSFVTHDVTYRIDLNDNITINAMLQNLTDEEPPFARTELNYDPVTHNALGRTFKLGAKVRF